MAEISRAADVSSGAQQLRVGIAGVGTVGASVVRLLAQQDEALRARTGRKIVVTAMSARDKAKDRGFDASAIKFFDDPVALAASDDIDLFVELIGGDEGPARISVEMALKAGKGVVTANKALLAKHGLALAALAEEKRVALAYEASVAGGIPIIANISQCLSANQIESRLRHSQRHLQLHPLQNGDGGNAVRRLPEGGAAAGLCGSRSDLRHRRLRHRPQARDPRLARLRHGDRRRRHFSRGHRARDARRSEGGRRTRLPHQAARRRPAHAAWRGAARASHHGAQDDFHRAGDGRDQRRHHRRRRRA